MSVGIDIVKIERIAHLQRHKNFLDKVFTQRERAYIEQNGAKAVTVAGLFAAKEAIAKVLGRGIGPVPFQAIEIVHDAAGKPSAQLSGDGAALFQERGFSELQLSISHESEYATAIALGFGKPQPPHCSAVSIQPELALSLLHRDRQGYKTQYGRIGLIGGSTGMAGSICMSAQAAMRTGAGMSYAIVPASLATVVQCKLTETIVRPIADDGRGCFTMRTISDVLRAAEGCDVLAIGPGLGRDSDTPVWLRMLLENTRVPVVLDADALYAAAQDRSMLALCRGRCVITPHEAEMSRLTGASLPQIRAQRAQIATEFAAEHGILVVLKGADTVISDGSVYYLNNTGNPGMATAGSGDVLTGMMAALFGYGYPLRLAVRLACYLHGVAGDLAREEKGEDGMIATDIIAQIPYALKMMKEIVE